MVTNELCYIVSSLKKWHWTFSSLWGFDSLIVCIVTLIVTVLMSVATDHDRYLLPDMLVQIEIHC